MYELWLAVAWGRREEGRGSKEQRVTRAVGRLEMVKMDGLIQIETGPIRP